VTGLFEQAMWKMRRHNPQTGEDGYHELLPHAATHLDELIREFRAEQDDHGLRCWLLELIAEARSPRALAVLVDQLDNPDEALRSRAVRGLELLDTTEARRALRHARSADHPDTRA
jgi:hypothetical protein